MKYVAVTEPNAARYYFAWRGEEILVSRRKEDIPEKNRRKWTVRWGTDLFAYCPACRRVHIYNGDYPRMREIVTVAETCEDVRRMVEIQEHFPKLLDKYMAGARALGREDLDYVLRVLGKKPGLLKELLRSFPETPLAIEARLLSHLL